MRRLILMRHAKSDWSHGTDDHDRPLNPRGRNAALALGDWLRKQDLLPNAVLCSTATRTCQTCAGLALPDSTDVAHVAALYLAEPAQILDTLRQRAMGGTVLLIAHNPGIANTAAALLKENPGRPGFDRYPSGATTVIDFEIDDWAALDWRMGKLHDFVVPKELT